MKPKCTSLGTNHVKRNNPNQLEINMYWLDLSESVQEQLRDLGFEPSNQQWSENEPIGILTIPDSHNGESQLNSNN